MGTLALSVSSLTQCEAPSLSAGRLAVESAAGMAKLTRRKVQPPSSDLETFLIVEMWKGTSRPCTGISTASCLPSTNVWCVFSDPPEEPDEVG